MESPATGKRPPKIVNALGQAVKQKYTDNGLLESVIAPSGKRNKMNYNKDGQLVSAASASGAETMGRMKTCLLEKS